MGIDPVTMTIGAAVLAGGSSIAGGFADNAAARSEAKQYEENAKLAKLSAEQSAEERQRDLMGTLSSIRNIRTSRGLDPSSPTGQAINERLTGEVGTAMSIDRLNSLMQQSQFHGAAAAARARGKTSLLRGFLDAGAYGLSAAGKMGGTGGGGGNK